MALPPWTQGLLLQNRPGKQVMRGELVNFNVKKIFASRSTDIILKTAAYPFDSEIQFRKPGPLSNTRIIFHLDGTLSIDNRFRVGGEWGETTCVSNSEARNVNTTNFTGRILITSKLAILGVAQRIDGVVKQTIPTNSYDTTPKATNNTQYKPLQLFQGTITNFLDNSRLFFTYQFNPAIPNNISFRMKPDLIESCFFIRNIDGTVELPVLKQFDVAADGHKILTITNIPPDVNNNCSAMLFYI